MKNKYVKILIFVIPILLIGTFILYNSYSATVEELDAGIVEKDGKVVILNEKGLMEFASQVNGGNDYSGKYVTLSADIDLKGYDWVSIGNGDRSKNDIAFKGTFDGYNHTIKNLNVSGESANGCYGLFGIINDATITNVVLESGEIKTSVGTTGGIVACMLGNKNTVENNRVEAGVTITGDTTGGIVGRAYGKENYIYNNENAAFVTGIKKTGGIAGIDNNVSILYGNKNTGNVVGGTDGTAGILGYGNGNSMVANCENNGDVTATRYLGGIVGYAAGTNSYVVYSVNNGKVTSENSTGGILGVLAQSGAWNIQNCKNNGEITGGSVSLSTLGGIVGSLSGAGSITNCENTASVIGGTYAGGIAGQVNAKTFVKNNKGGTAKIEGTKYNGRLLGSVTGSSTDILSGNACRLFIDDSNGDSYDNIMTVGVVAPLTGNSLLIVEEGTLHGAPWAGTQARIKIQKTAAWDFKPDAAGKMYKDAGTNPGKDTAVLSNTWDKEVIDYGETTSVIESTTSANGQRTYLVGGVEKTEVVNKVPVLWNVEVVKEEKMVTNVNFTSMNDNSTKEFDIDKKVELPNNEVIIESSDKNVGLMFLYSDDTLAAQAKYYEKLIFNSNGGNDIEEKIVFLDNIDHEPEVVLEEKPIKDGYVFDGWYLDKDFTQKVENTKIKYNTEVYAKWVSKTDIKNPTSESNSKNDGKKPVPESSPKTDDGEDNPQTYDNIIFWDILAFISIAGILAIAVYIKKHEI